MRSALAVCALGCAASGVAQAAPLGSPQFTMAPHTKAQPIAGAGQLTMRWLPPGFDVPDPADHQQIQVSDLTVPDSSNLELMPPTQATRDIPVIDGHSYRITVAACTAADCFTPTPGPATIQTTRIDAKAPTGTVLVEDGALATRSRDVGLSLTADDPLISGIAGSSSGIDQSAIDVDGDGTFACIAGGDTSGCAFPFTATETITLPAGDGIKTVGARFGDGARAVSPCAPGSCAPEPFGAFLGNQSAVVTDTIILDTLRPVAAASLNRTSVVAGGPVSFDASDSADPGPATPSGIEPAATVWTFDDGSPDGSGLAVSRSFTRPGTVAGTVRVRDRAGNVSLPRSFKLTVLPAPVRGPHGGGNATGITGSASFTISDLRVSAIYARSRLTGVVGLDGIAEEAGALRVELRRRSGALVRRLSTSVGTTSFARTLTLPRNLPPGTYRLVFVGPGGTLSASLVLRPPREGFVSFARLVATRFTSTARFRFSSVPVRALRGRMTVTWNQGIRIVGSVKVRQGLRIRARLPRGAVLRKGILVATLRADGTAVASASVRLR